MVESLYSNEDLRQHFSHPDDEILLEYKVTKINYQNIEQQRTLITAGNYIYLFNNSKLERRHRITSISAFIISYS